MHSRHMCSGGQRTDGKSLVCEGWEGGVGVLRSSAVPL